MNQIIKVLLIVFILGACNAKGLLAQKRLPCLEKKFTILAHIFLDSTGSSGISESSIQNTVIAMNGYFEPICASFEICEFEYLENWDYQVHHQKKDWEELQVIYNRDRVINLYYVQTIIDPEGKAGFGSLGGVKSTSSGGILMNTVDDIVLTHEMGHYFGLPHPFGNDSTTLELVDGSNCLTAGDGICDTPADPFVDGDNQSDYLDNCIFINVKKKDANGDFFDPHVNNIMGYYTGCDPLVFTPGQYRKMAETYLSNPGKW